MVRLQGGGRPVSHTIRGKAFPLSSYETPWRYAPEGAGSGPVYFRDGSWVAGYRPGGEGLPATA